VLYYTQFATYHLNSDANCQCVR